MAHGGDGDLDRNFATVPAQCSNLKTLVENGTLAGSKELPDFMFVGLSIAGRDNCFGKNPSVDLCLAPPKSSLRLRIPIHDPSLGVHSDKGVKGCFKDLSKPFLAGLKFRGLCGEAAINQ